MELRKRVAARQDVAMTGAVVRAVRRRWLIEIAPGDLRLVGSAAELGDLLRHGPVTADMQVYEVGAGPRALRNVPELARLLPQIEDSEPPIRPRPVREETRSPERAKLSEELAVLNRPLEGDIEYYDEVPRSRMKPVLAVVVLAAIACAGYLWLAQRHRADDRPAVVPAKMPATEPARAPVAPAAASPAAGAASSTLDRPDDPEPEGDPPLPSAAAGRARYR
jgi:hypothetical protein